MRIVVFACVLVSANFVSATQTVPQYLPKLKHYCSETLKYGCEYVLPESTDAQASHETCELAGRLSGMVTDTCDLIWPKKDCTSEERMLWRELMVEGAGISAYAHTVSATRNVVEAISKEQADLVVKVFEQTNTFVTDYCKIEKGQKEPIQLKSRSDEKVRAPLHDLGDAAARNYATVEEAHLERLRVLTHSGADWISKNYLSPENLTRLILAFRIPEGQKAAINKEIRARLKRDFPDQCRQIGEYILNSISQLSDRTLKGFTFVAAKISSKVLRPFSASIGAFILAAVEDVLTSEDNRAIPITELLIKSLSQAKEASSAQLKASFEEAIDNQFRAFLVGLIDEDMTLYKTVKGAVDETLTQLKPLLVDFVWNREDRVAQQLLFYYAPPLLKEALLPKEIREAMPMLAERIKAAQDIGRLSAEVAAHYVWQERAQENGFRNLFIEMVRSTAEEIVYVILGQPGSADPNQGALRSAKTLTMLHLFLEDHKTGNYRAQLDADLNKPLFELVEQVAAHKHYDLRFRERIKAFMQRGSAAFFKTVLDPKTICNLLIRFDFPDANAAKMSESVEANAHPRPDAAFNDPFGHAVVRTLESFLSLSGQLGTVNSALIRIAKQFRGTIGQRILNGDPGDYTKAVRQLLFKQSERGPRLGAKWIGDENVLKTELNNWIKFKLMVFIRNQIQASVPWGFKKLVQIEVDSIVPPLLVQIDKLLWEKDQRALKILVFYYLLPAWKEDVLRAAIRK